MKFLNIPENVFKTRFEPAYKSANFLFLFRLKLTAQKKIFYDCRVFLEDEPSSKKMENLSFRLNFSDFSTENHFVLRLFLLFFVDFFRYNCEERS